MGVVIEIEGVGPTEFPDEAAAEAYFKTQAQAKPPDLPKNFAVRARALPASGASAVQDRAAQLATVGKRDVQLQKAATELAEAEAGKQLSEDQSLKFASQAYMFDLLKQIAETKNQGYSRKKGKSVVRVPVDTGPIAKFYPNAVSSWYNRAIDNQDPWDATARARLEQSITKVINPERKETTGAAAAESEIAKYIAPTMPGMGDDDDDFNAKLIQSAQLLAERNRNELAVLREQGYRVPDSLDLASRMAEFTGAVPKKYQVRPAQQRPQEAF